MSEKKTVQAALDELNEAKNRCAERVQHLERGIQRFLDAYDSSEMSNVEAAIVRLRRLMAQI